MIDTFLVSSVLYTKVQFNKVTSVSIVKRVVEAQSSRKNHCDKNIRFKISCNYYSYLSNIFPVP